MELNFQKGRNYFHTLTETVINAEGGVINGTVKITGFSDQKIEVGDIINILQTKYTVTECERRDHKGVFTDPQDKINGFFSAQCTFSKATPSK